MDAAVAVEAPLTGRRTSRWATGVLAAYLVLWMVRLILVAEAPGVYARTIEWTDSLGVRLVLGVVVLAAVFHTLDGLRLIVGGLVPSLAEASRGLTARGAVAFGTWLLVIPAWVLLLRPWIEDAL